MSTLLHVFVLDIYSLYSVGRKLEDYQRFCRYIYIYLIQVEDAVLSVPMLPNGTRIIKIPERMQMGLVFSFIR